MFEVSIRLGAEIIFTFAVTGDKLPAAILGATKIIEALGDEHHIETCAM